MRAARRRYARRSARWSLLLIGLILGVALAFAIAFQRQGSPIGIVGIVIVCVAGATLLLHQGQRIVVDEEKGQVVHTILGFRAFSADRASARAETVRRDDLEDRAFTVGVRISTQGGRSLFVADDEWPLECVRDLQELFQRPA